jgi:hypothetical protein
LGSTNFDNSDLLGAKNRKTGNVVRLAVTG